MYAVTGLHNFINSDSLILSTSEEAALAGARRKAHRTTRRGRSGREIRDAIAAESWTSYERYLEDAVSSNEEEGDTDDSEDGE